MGRKHFASYEQLERYLRDFTNFGGGPVPYDFNGVLRLLLAVADNLRDNSYLDAHAEDIQSIVTPKQAEFLSRLARTAGTSDGSP
jgi:hypothetical protein